MIAALSWAGYSAEQLLQLFQQRLHEKSIQVLFSDPADKDAIILNDAGKISRIVADVVRDTERVGSSRFYHRWAGRTSLLSHWMWNRQYITKLRERIIARGLFEAKGFETWLDALMLLKLNENRKSLGLPLLPNDHRPTFSDFFDIYYRHGSKELHGALFVVLGNLSRTDVTIVDSLSSAYQHLIVSEVVRASVSFPGFFTPKELSIWRDSDTGVIASRETLIALSGRKHCYLSRELFVDGGTIANFPMWLILQNVRDILWGESDASGEIRLVDGETFMVGEKAIDDMSPERPLSTIAFRPMVHLGLQLSSNNMKEKRSAKTNGPRRSRLSHTDEFLEVPLSELNDASEYWSRLAQMLVGGARSWLETHLLDAQKRITGSRVFVSTQSLKETGWNFHVMDFHKLNAKVAGSLFDTGLKFAREDFSNLTFAIPLDGGPQSISNVSFRLIEEVNHVIAEILGVPVEACQLFSSVYVLTGLGSDTSLTEILRTSNSEILPATQRITPHDEDDDVEEPEAECYGVRSVMVKPAQSWWLNADVIVDSKENKKPCQVRVMLPLVDTLEQRRQFYDIADRRYSLTDQFSLQETEWGEGFVDQNKVRGVLLGLMTVDVVVDEATDVASIWTPIFHKLSQNQFPLEAFRGAAAGISELLSKGFGAMSGSA